MPTRFAASMAARCRAKRSSLTEGKDTKKRASAPAYDVKREEGLARSPWRTSMPAFFAIVGTEAVL